MAPAATARRRRCNAEIRSRADSTTRAASGKSSGQHLRQPRIQLFQPLDLLFARRTPSEMRRERVASRVSISPER